MTTTVCAGSPEDGEAAGRAQSVRRIFAALRGESPPVVAGPAPWRRGWARESLDRIMLGLGLPGSGGRRWGA
jgi:hypothetical protein